MFAVLAVVVPDRPDPTPKATELSLQDQILGDWRVVKNFNGAIDQSASNLTWVFTREAMHQFHENAKPGTRFPYTLDTMKNPAVIQFPSSKQVGLLKVDGETMTVCLHFNSKGEPPAGFELPASAQATLLHLTRIKK